MRFAGSLAIIIATVISSPIIAQGKIDPATIAVPDVSLPKDRAAADDLIANGWKYHFFHKDRVSFETARADVAFCHGYLPKVQLLALPGYSSFQGVARKTKSSGNQSFGLVGAAIADVIGGAINDMLDRRDRVSRMRRCMETRGYTRYPMAKKLWESFDGRDPTRDVAILAKLASGPRPDLPVPAK